MGGMKWNYRVVHYIDTYFYTETCTLTHTHTALEIKKNNSIRITLSTKTFFIPPGYMGEKK